MRSTFLAFGALALALGSWACGSGQVSSGDLGDDWPLTVESATVECVRGSLPVVSIDGEGVFGLTGQAYTELDYARELPDEFWRDDPNTGAKVNVAPLRDLALERC